MSGASFRRRQLTTQRLRGVSRIRLRLVEYTLRPKQRKEVYRGLTFI